MKKAIMIMLIGATSFSFNTSLYCQESDGRLLGNEPEPTSLKAVLGHERLSNNDIILLRNGDRITGTILNENFNIRTFYSQLKFNKGIIAGIDFEGGTNNIESIITVNNNRFSGFLDDLVFVIKLQTGPKIEVRKEKILKAIFRVRDSERKGIPQRLFIILKNGDFFSGKIKNDYLLISTTYAEIPLTLNNAESIRLIGNENPLTKVKMLNGDVLEGILKTEDIKMELDVGPEVKIYKDRVDLIYCRPGYVPNKKMVNENTSSSFSSIGPAEIVLKTAQAKKPAYFPHKKHQDKYTCGICHHDKDSSGRLVKYTQETVIYKCTTCHNTDMPNKELNGFQLIGHKLCRECHRTKRDSTSAKCRTCHRRNQ